MALRSKQRDVTVPDLRSLLRHAETLIGIGLFFVLWALAHVAVGRFLPSPVEVIGVAAANLYRSRYFVGLGLPEGGYLPHLLSTAETALLGCLIGSAIGIASGLASALSRILFQITRPIAAILGTIPILVASPFFLIWFGVSDRAKITLVCFYSAVVLHTYALRAVEHLHPSYAEYARTLGARPTMVFRRVLLPGCVPELFGGIRAALGAAWGLSAITELLGTDRGMGRVIVATGGVQDLAAVMAALLLLSLVAILADAILMAGRRYATHWMPQNRQHG